MNTNEIIENNKLIAEFVGIVFTKDNKANHPLISAPYPPIECYKYHTSWDWLMPVVEKVKEKCSELKIPYTDYLISALILVDKEVIYKAVIDFINWYNQQQK